MRLVRLERPERQVRLEHLENLRRRIRRGISGYILAKRVYPESMKEEMDSENIVIECQLKEKSNEAIIRFYIRNDGT